MPLKLLVPLLLIIWLIVAIARESIYSLKEHERLVVFRFGRATAVRGPGLVLLIPILERGSRFDMADDFQAKLVHAYELQFKERSEP